MLASTVLNAKIEAFHNRTKRSLKKRSKLSLFFFPDKAFNETNFNATILLKYIYIYPKESTLKVVKQHVLYKSNKRGVFLKNIILSTLHFSNVKCKEFILLYFFIFKIRSSQRGNFLPPVRAIFFLWWVSMFPDYCWRVLVLGVNQHLGMS